MKACQQCGPGSGDLAGNNFKGKSNAQLSATGHQAANVINAALLGYGVSGAQATAIETAADALDAAVTDVTAKKAALAAAYETQFAARASLISALNVVAGVIYENVNVTPSMLENAGYAVYDT